jgi:Holliday junction resolvase RusA-like endonuclease
MTLVITIPLKPIPKARPRAAIGKSALGQIKTVVYKDNKSANNEKALITLLSVHPRRPKKTMEGPLWLEFIANIKKPKSSENEYPVVKPDIDNYAKFLMDCLQKAKYFKDDCQIVGLIGHKIYITDGREPCWTICLSPYTYNKNPI